MRTPEGQAPATARRGWAGQLLGVVLAGGAGLLVDVALLWVLAVELAVPRGLAALVSFSASAVVNFAINRGVFGGGGSDLSRHGRRYAVLFSLNLVVTTLAVPLLADGFDGVLDPDVALLVAKAVTVLGLVLVNTVLYRTWVFAEAATADDGKR